jgi:hypothetical protein
MHDVLSVEMIKMEVVDVSGDQSDFQTCTFMLRKSN